MDYIETQRERTDLPLIVIPTIFESMREYFVANLPTLQDVARVRMYTTETRDPDTIVDRCKDADTVMIIGFRTNNGIFERLSTHVRCFVFGGTGVSNFIDLPRSRKLGIRVCNTFDYGSDAVAEYTFALILELTRQVGIMAEESKTGAWDRRAGVTLKGKTLGILGFGGIGQAVAGIAIGFGMKTLVWNSHLHADAVAKYGVTPVDTIDELMAASDIVTLHLPVTDETRQSITLANLEHMKPGSILVNAARAELLAPGALVERLKQGDIQAALDVYEQEPLPADDPLHELTNVLLSPHAAWLTDDAYAEIARQMTASARSFYQGEDFNVVV